MKWLAVSLTLLSSAALAADATSIGVGSTAIVGGTTTNVLSNNGGLVGETVTDGTGDVVRASTLGGCNFKTTASWTPSDQSGATLTFTAVTASYSQVCGEVISQFFVTYPTTADTSSAKVSTPVAVGNHTYNNAPSMCTVGSGSVAVMILPIPNGSTAQLYNAVSQANVTNASLSGKTLACTLIYTST